MSVSDETFGLGPLLVGLLIGVMAGAGFTDCAENPSIERSARDACESQARTSWTCRTVRYAGPDGKPAHDRSCTCEAGGAP